MNQRGTTSSGSGLLFGVVGNLPLVEAASIIALGDVPGGDYISFGIGVADGGLAVAGYSVSATGNEAFRWTSTAGMIGLGDLAGGQTESYGREISADGKTIVGNSFSANGGSEAFRWNHTEGMVGLGDFPGNSFISQAMDVSSDGAVIVGYGYPQLGTEAFRWTEATGMVGLGDLPGGSYLSIAEGVSPDGRVVVGYSNSANGDEAFRWTAEGGMVGLGDLFGGGLASRVTDATPDGATLVGFGTGPLGRVAVRWTKSGGMSALGSLPGGTDSSATAISADARTVVGTDRVEGRPVAFVWREGLGTQSLLSLLIEQGVDPALDGWTQLRSARDISGDGRFITGFGIRAGNPEAFLVEIQPVPEATTQGAVPSSGILTLLLMYRRRCRGLNSNIDSVPRSLPQVDTSQATPVNPDFSGGRSNGSLTGGCGRMTMGPHIR
jgi:probable HAF family extracellular repeat protein